MRRLRIALVGALTMALLLTGISPGLAVPKESYSGLKLTSETVETRFGAIDPSMTLADQARVLFPGEPKMQFTFISQAMAVDLRTTGAGTNINPRALPIVLAPFVAVLARCVWGALTGAVVNEVITLVHQGKQADAQSRVYALVGGCIGSVFPPFLKPLAQRVQNELAGAVLWVIVQLGPKR
ncbi:hypothetical protein AB0323_22275 [Arthrobacter sp. NPDC080031]|uniref:hypothetical protein n=1 Tax=Arthrobacter sp. NPDC080031 TaxID=3155918 RepID=UPI00344D4004